MKYSYLCIVLTLIALTLINCQMVSAQKSSSGSKKSATSTNQSNNKKGEAAKKPSNTTGATTFLDLIYPNFKNASSAFSSRKTQGKRQNENEENLPINDVIEYLQETGQLGIEFAEQVLEDVVQLLRNISEARNNTFGNSEPYIPAFREKI